MTASLQSPQLSGMNNDGSADASYAEIWVTDTGIGIAADFLPHGRLATIRVKMGHSLIFLRS